MYINNSENGFNFLNFLIKKHFVLKLAEHTHLCTYNRAVYKMYPNQND